MNHNNPDANLIEDYEPTGQAASDDYNGSLTLQSQFLKHFLTGRHSFIPYLSPENALNLTGDEILAILQDRYGEIVQYAVSPEVCDPSIPPTSLPDEFLSPLADQPDGRWLSRTDMVGVNVRTVGSFWNIIKYALTLPHFQNAIHILPIWEPGVVGSMYGMSSWLINTEFYSDEMAALLPHLNTVEKQLCAVIHLLHVMGKAVGMDVIPHTDRFSEIVLAYPEFFEWLQRDHDRILRHPNNLHEEVQEITYQFLVEEGPAGGGALPSRDVFYAHEQPDAYRGTLLFGLPDDPFGRRTRRNVLIRRLFAQGFEPVPATMAPPYRGIEVDPRPEARHTDENGMTWVDYRIVNPQPMSRVFGPLARYKLYENLDDNQGWEIDFNQPRHQVWAYVCQQYAGVQKRFGFDFMRGDMSHVQMRPDGVPSILDEQYDILGAVKAYIQSENDAPYFSYFAETFLAPRDVMGYGEEIDHLEATLADTTLGDLQSVPVDSRVFLQRLRYYHDLVVTRTCIPAFTVMTADKDDPRFDSFYLTNNEARCFMSFFITDMPGYIGLGFETRDPHPQPAPNEHYTKLYVFQESIGEKATHGPYVWGKNDGLFRTITRVRLFAEQILGEIAGVPVHWLIPPDALGENKVIAWTQAESPRYLFVVNTHASRTLTNVGIPLDLFDGSIELAFTTHALDEAAFTLQHNGYFYQLAFIHPGEARAYRLSPQKGQQITSN